MEKSIQDVLRRDGDNYIFPFLWMRGEEEPVIREELAKIDACGIKSVCLEARPHPDFAGEGWWHDVDIVLDEARKRGMKIWILDDAHFPTGMANGLLEQKYPERAKQYVMTKAYDIVGPMPYAELDLKEVMKKDISWMDLGKPVEEPLVNENVLVGVTARRVIHDDVVSTDCMDLTEFVKDGTLLYTFPEGVWRVFVSYTTYEGGGKREYINIIDKDSVGVLLEAVYETHYSRYKDEFGNIIAGFFSDEPELGNVPGYDTDTSIGRKMMPLPWNKDVPVMLEERLGKEWRQALPYLWYEAEEEAESANARFIYMDIITRLYEKNFCGQIGNWCEDHGVEYIGHVIEDNNMHSRLGSGAGHYFRAMSGQHMAGIDNIGGQIMFGNPDGTHHDFSAKDGKFFHYVLAKMGASAALFDPKKKGRLMCETFGAYGWSLGVKNMKWIVDHLVIHGVNHFVPHAFSMAEFPDFDCPPHFYARGNNPQFLFFAELMKYTNRLCHVFNGGKAVPEVGILYHGDLEWTNDCMYMQEPAEVLAKHQIDYNIVPLDVFEETEKFGTHMDGEVLVVNGVRIKMLIIPETRFIDSRLIHFMKNNPQLPVIFINRLPEAILDTDGEVQADTSCLSNCAVVSLCNLTDALGERNIRGLDIADAGGQGAESISYYRYQKENEEVLMLFNESSYKVFTGTVCLPFSGKVACYDAMKNCLRPVKQKQQDGGCICSLMLRPYESVVLVEAEANVGEWKEAEFESKDISENWEVAFADAKEYPSFNQSTTMDHLQPISLMKPKFSGFMRYEKTVWMERADGEIYLEAEHIFENARVLVNGVCADMRVCPPYRFDLSGYCKAGENKIVVEVANTLSRGILNYDLGPLGPEKIILEPSGMFGSIIIKQSV